MARSLGVSESRGLMPQPESFTSKRSSKALAPALALTPTQTSTAPQVVCCSAWLSSCTSTYRES